MTDLDKATFDEELRCFTADGDREEIRDTPGAADLQQSVHQQATRSQSGKLGDCDQTRHFGESCSGVTVHLQSDDSGEVPGAQHPRTESSDRHPGNLDPTALLENPFSHSLCDQRLYCREIVDLQRGQVEVAPLGEDGPPAVECEQLEFEIVSTA